LFRLLLEARTGPLFRASPELIPRPVSAEAVMTVNTRTDDDLASVVRYALETTRAIAVGQCRGARTQSLVARSCRFDLAQTVRHAELKY
jgi:hypothetical protein